MKTSSNDNLYYVKALLVNVSLYHANDDERHGTYNINNFVVSVIEMLSAEDWPSSATIKVAQMRFNVQVFTIRRRSIYFSSDFLQHFDAKLKNRQERPEFSVYMFK